jgi:hypothetical protein
MTRRPCCDSIEMQNCDCVKFRFHGLSRAMQKHINLETIKAILPPTRNPRPEFVNFLSAPLFIIFTLFLWILTEYPRTFLVEGYV